MKYKPKKIAQWVAVNSLMWAFAIVALIYGNEMAANCLKFSVWAFSFPNILGAFSEKILARWKKETPSVPLELGVWSDILLAIFVAAHSWFGYAAIIFLSAALYYSGHLPDEDESIPASSPE